MPTINKIWIKDTNYSDYIQNNGTSIINVERTTATDDSFVETAVLNKKLNIKYVSSQFDSNEANGAYTEVLKLSALPGGYDSFQEFQDDINSLLNAKYTNHYTTIQTQQRTQTNNNSSFIYSANSAYNYYARGYEEFNAATNEKQIANFYVELGEDNGELKVLNNNNPNQEFFESIGVTRGLTPVPVSLTKQLNIIVDRTDSISSELANYPFYNTLNMDTHHTGRLINYINRSGLIFDLLDFYINRTPSNTAPFDILVAAGDTTVRRDSTTQIFPFTTWITNQNYALENENITTILSDVPTKIVNDIFGNFSKVVLNGIFRNTIKESLRTIKDVLNNKPCSNEVLFYKLDKYVTNYLGQPVQTFWFANKEEAFQYYDTQVKYGEIYAYRVSAYTLIIGNDYSYTNPVFNKISGQFYAELTVSNGPSAQLVEVPLYEYQIASIQNPPLQPHVSFSTKMSAEKNIKITLSHMVGEQLAPFNSIISSDTAQARLMNLVAFNYNGNSGMSYFSSRGLPEYFEVYRTETAPTSYSDFVGRKIADAKQFFPNTRKTSSHVSINDFVSPNVKYYYMLRAVNLHGLVSNPTKVIELTLIIDADDSKIQVNEYSFPEMKTFDNFKTFNSLLQVVPSLDQTLFVNDEPLRSGVDQLQQVEKLTLMYRLT